ncbi:class I SAM-dependent methyltransferase [Aquisalimonas lutea]|uniref:class I SAM-dependent methyltransferase n=1 Tax=Aquisalimonas lutea TaxID=1327750 RepID=UPI0025B3E885|nr:class I SAM-dependent methyltransferase [Aquisalimonas lutea]MDN3517154.1 class I SAM-dependent methyltransferase [Aquisalimonas lutea]
MAKRYSKPDQRLLHMLEADAITRRMDTLTRRGERMLDLPCGYGRFTAHALRRGLQVSVADINPDMLELVQQRLGPLDSHCCRSDCLPFPDNTFDTALCVRLLQHLHEREVRVATLRELARVTRRGIIATIYDRTRLHRVLHGKRNLKRLHRYSPESLHDELEAAGLSLVKARRILPGVHAQQVLMLRPAA